MPQNSIEIKRIYAPASPDDGTRVLIDRLWPRGVSKERAQLTLWLKAVAPSTELREWFGHKPENMQAFTAAYQKELDTDAEKQQAIAQLLDMAKKQKLTLLYGAKDPTINHAIVLKHYLETKQ